MTTGIVLDGSGETTCPDPALPCDYDDASDSYAATLLEVAWTYYEEGGSAGFLTGPGKKAAFETVASVILALQQADGLTWAKDSYRVKYVMDNSETYRGLRCMEQLEELVFNDPAAAQLYGDAADAVQAGIEAGLFNGATGLYRVAKFENGAVQEANLNQWYPGTVAIVWPHLCGVIEGSSARARAQMDALNGSWDGTPNPDWTSHFLGPGGFPWPSIGQAAILAGDLYRGRKHTRFVLKQKLPAFGWPITVIDAGWLLRNLAPPKVR